jgi:hypothetical protein
MIYTGVEPTLVTLFGNDADLLGRTLDKRYPTAARRLRNLSPRARGKLRLALHRPTPGMLRALRNDPELMGVWPFIAKAAKAAAKLGAKGLKAVAARVRAKRASKAAKGKARAAAKTPAARVPAAKPGMNLAVYGLPVALLLAFFALTKGR